jgi:hypothetical protein
VQYLKKNREAWGIASFSKKSETKGKKKTESGISHTIYSYNMAAAKQTNLSSGDLQDQV